MGAATVTAIGRAVPDAMKQDVLWADFFADYYQGSRTAARLFRSVGVETRHGAVNPCREDVSLWGNRARMDRYAQESLPLGTAAVSTALGSAGIQASDLGFFAVVSCTGYATPGLDILLARDLRMSPDLQRLFIAHMGCYAAIPGLGAVMDYVSVHDAPAVLLCVELTSLHLQPAPEVTRPLKEDTVQQMVAHALFGDAAVAVVVVPDAPHGIDVLDVDAYTAATTSSLMTYTVTDNGFRMGLSPQVPDVLATHVKPPIERLLARHGLGLPDVGGWVVHPGGPRIIEAVTEQLDLSATATRHSWDVLREYGNCSSTTVLMILDRVHDELTAGDPIVMLAFGPGLTLYSALLQVR